MNLNTQDKNTYADQLKKAAASFIEPKHMPAIASALLLGVEGVVAEIQRQRKAGEISACKEAYVAYEIGLRLAKSDDLPFGDEDWSEAHYKKHIKRLAGVIRGHGWALYAGMIEADMDAFLDLIEARDCYVA